MKKPTSTRITETAEDLLKPKQRRQLAIAYVRVSTREPGESGLRIDAQRAAVQAYCRENGYRLINEYQELETGRKKDRPALREAIARARLARGLLIIARLGGLSRSWRFIDELLDSGRLRFHACDVPNADPSFYRNLASINQQEATATSMRTKAGMAAARARGAVFSNPANLTPAACRKGARIANQVRRRKRDRTIARVAGRIAELRGEGSGYREIAGVLNDERFVTSHGNKWTGKTVWRALRRLRHFP
ncbi:MAG: recombinase family protein [Candidatus Cybelea sp.]